jgi:hypothetical protein
MSRTTQYIGLNIYALNYVRNAIRTETYDMTTGMFDEPVHGTIYHMPPPKGPNKALIAKEVVQATPWSSGMMIFTHLKLTLVKESDEEVDYGDVAFSWMVDPSLGYEQEYDLATGRFYV